MWNIILGYWENNPSFWANPIGPYDWFQWYFRYWLGKISLDDKMQINKWRGIVSKFWLNQSKWSKILIRFWGRFDDYSILPITRKILLHWGYELVENDLIRFGSWRIIAKRKK